MPKHINRLDFIFRLRTGLTPSPTNDCKKAAVAPPLAHQHKGNTMTKVDDILMFFCVSGFFAGVVVAVTTLPVLRQRLLLLLLWNGLSDQGNEKRVASRERRLSSITCGPWRRVMALPGQRLQAA